MSDSQKRRRGYQINIGLAKSEADAIDRAARAAGLSRAAYVRRLALNVVDVPETTVSRRYRKLTTADTEAISVLVSKLGQTAGATIQLSKSLRKEGRRELHAEAEAVLSDLRKQASHAISLVEKLGAQW